MWLYSDKINVLVIGFPSSLNSVRIDLQEEIFFQTVIPVTGSTTHFHALRASKDLMS